MLFSFYSRCWGCIHLTKNIHLSFVTCSLYPSVCLENDFPVGPGTHLKGPQMCSRLSLDYEKGCFVYKDPFDNSCKEIDGIAQCIVGIDPQLHELNSLPFLPMRLGQEGKTFWASCRKCVMERKKSLCKHNMLQRIWREVYNLKELAYAVSQLKYTLFCIEECLIYTTLLPIFKDFMQLMSSKKIKYSKIPPSYKSNLDEYCNQINQEMKFTQDIDVLSPEALQANEFQCSFIKGLMNIVVGQGWC